MTREEAIALHREELDPGRRAAIRIVTGGAPSGNSIFGGDQALLPPGLPWPVLHVPNAEPPEHQGQLCLLAQIDFAEVRLAVPELANDLPPAGVLQIFSTRQVPYSDWELPLSPWSNPRVFFWRPDTELVLRNGPGVPQTGVGLRFELWDTFDRDVLIDLDEEAQDALWIPYGEHHMLGHTLPLQDYPEAELQGKVPVLVLTYREDLEWYFDDCGAMYFHADPDAWREGRLEGLAFELQSH